VIRSVPSSPDTFALMRVVWREASITYTRSAAMPLACASRTIGSRTRASVRRVYRLNSGAMKIGAISAPTTTKPVVTAAPSAGHARGKRWSTSYRTVTAMPPSTSDTPSPTT
jgi:hypothetical protein